MRFYPLYVLDAKQYEAVMKLKELKQKLNGSYSYSDSNYTLLDKYVTDGTAEIYAADNTDDVKTILISYNKKLNNVERKDKKER